MAQEPPLAVDWLARRRRLESLLRLQAAVMSGDPGQVEAVRLLADALGDADTEVRELAAAALSEFGPDAQIALPELIKACQDESTVVRRRAIRAIGFIGPIAADDALPAVIAATEDREPSVALQAIASLGEFGPLAAPAIPALMSAVWTGEVRRRAIAGASLTLIGHAALASLTQSLSHPAAEIRAKVAHLLGRMGPPAADARPALQSLLTDRDESVRAEAAEAMRLINQR